MRPDFNISHKANRVLNIILLAFLLIFIRVWYLSFMQRDEHVLKALRPQRKTVIDKIERATVRDRFNIPLATNKIQYNATVRYADLRQIPSGVWKKDLQGKKYREPVRSNYIQSLSSYLGKELNMDPITIEDTIHAKASLFPQTPFVIKENLSEQEYYKLKLKEKDWIGFEAQKTSQRIYPLGKVGCDIIGYLGSINQNEYVRIAGEIKDLQEYIEKRNRGELCILPAGYNNALEVRQRLKELQEKSYTINDLIGKTGIEGVYEETLRGLHGKKNYEVDRKGNIIRTLASSKKSVSGQRVLLSISSELQEYAEGLLAHNEGVRHIRDISRMIGVARPWILGGAIVAMDPNTGEVIAMASYPRFDPNDFIPEQTLERRKEKQKSVLQWLENELLVGKIWDGKQALERERYDLDRGDFYVERESLTWKKYLDTILPPSSSCKKSIESIETVGRAKKMLSSIKKIAEILQEDDIRDVIQCLYSKAPHIQIKKNMLSEKKELINANIQHHYEEITVYKNFLDKYLLEIKHNDDKVLVLDLCRLLLEHDETEETNKWDNLPLGTLHDIHQALCCLSEIIQEEVQMIHHALDFSAWRNEYFKEYLKQKRKEEKDQKKYVQPYTEYLDKVEKALFRDFWSICRPYLINVMIQGKDRATSDEYVKLSPYIDKLLTIKEEKIRSLPFFKTLEVAFKDMHPPESLNEIKHIAPFSEMTSPLWGKYRLLRNTSGEQQLKHLAGAFYPLSGYGYGRSQAYRQAAAQGSVFKLVTAYEAMRQRYHHLGDNNLSTALINPLTLVDQLRFDKINTTQQVLGYTLEGDSIKRFFKGGMLPRSHANIGKIDVRGALEQSSNLYFSYLASEYIESPELLEQAAKNFGYGTKTGLELYGEITGNIPKDLSDNRTGLYSFAIGQHSLVVTPIQACVMLSTIANKGKVLKPKVVQLTAGKKQIADPFSEIHEGFPFQEQLGLVGIHFPLFTEAVVNRQENEINWSPTDVKREIFLPTEIRNMLIEGMQRVINGSKGTARPGVIKALTANPKIYKDYIDLRHQLIGKTGTAETLYKQWIDSESKAEISNNIWFGGISFHKDKEGNADLDKPELAVAVYLKFSDTGGKEAAPLAAQIVTKWREICEKHGKSSHINIERDSSTRVSTENIEW